jgi:signal peptidase II
MSEKNKWTISCNLPQKFRFGLLGISLIVIILDQVSKYYARHHLELHEFKPVTKFWNWTLAYNQGAAFSLFADQGGWQQLFFGAIAFVVMVGLVYYILNRAFSGLTGIALSFILGGATGNLIDRILLGKVTDFIDWYYSVHHWPTFNIADSFISIGVAILIIESLFFAKGNKCPE